MAFYANVVSVWRVVRQFWRQVTVDRAGRSRRFLIAPLALGLIAALMSVAYQRVDAAGIVEVYPNSVGSTIPVNYPSVRYKLYNGNWTGRVTFPSTAPAGTMVEIASDAQYDTELVTAITDLPAPSIVLKKGQSIRFVFSGIRWQYRPAAGDQTPGTTGPTVLMRAGELIPNYVVTSTDFIDTIGLPADAADGAMIILRSYTPKTSRIDPAKLLYPVSSSIRSTSYLLSFRAREKRWVIASSPEYIRIPEGVSAATWVLPASDAPLIHYQIYNDAWRPSIELPTNPADRDRIRITSYATNTVMIYPRSNIDYAGTMAVLRGQTYEFMYIAERKLWVMRNSPRPEFNAPGIVSAFSLPMWQSSPTIVYTASEQAFADRLYLPQLARPGDRVLVRNETGKSFAVSNGSSDLAQVAGYEIVRFENRGGAWSRVSNTVDLLLTYGEDAVAALGEGAMQARMLEGLRLTNESLDNSDANFFFNRAAFLRHTVPGTIINDTLGNILTDSVVLSARDTAKADGVYYEGKESGCGLAYVRAGSSYMAAAGTLDCGTTVMRHELGHNMALSHCELAP